MQPILIDAVFDSAHDYTLPQSVEILDKLGYGHHVIKVCGASDTYINLAVFATHGHLHPERVGITFIGGPGELNKRYYGTFNLFVADRLLRAIAARGLHQVETVVNSVIQKSVEEVYDNDEYDDMAALERYCG